MMTNQTTDNHPPSSMDLPLAFVHGKPVQDLPKDLYIPPDALEVVLEAFEGPLDLLLYLIRRQNLDILDIPITDITQQYMAYIDMMHGAMRLELTAEYLLMAATLAEIKSRLLLPTPNIEEEEEQDPRAELIRRLQLYEQFKNAAQAIDELPRMERDLSPACIHFNQTDIEQTPVPVNIQELLLALTKVVQRAEFFTPHEIKREPLSVRQYMSELLTKLSDGRFHPFPSLLSVTEGRSGAVVSFLALLELSKEQLIDIVQQTPLATIYVATKTA